MLGLHQYKQLEKPVLYAIIAEFFMQMINSSFMTILLIYMAKEGYEDYESANYVSYRFLAVLLFAFPLGLYIKGKKLKHIFYASTILTPTAALFILYGVENQISLLLNVSLFLWGIGFMLIQTPILPFILRNAKTENHTAGISLSYSTWSMAGIVSGFFIYFLSQLFGEIFDEKLLLQLISISGYIGIYFIYKIQQQEISPTELISFRIRDFDWHLIFQSLFPTFIIAVGAGLTIPFVGLFFYAIHGVDSYYFALISMFTTIIVFFSIIAVPKIKQRFGYKYTIPVTQSVAIAALFLLATTEWFSHQSFAVMIAIFCYMLRQPLMNIAGPMTSDVILQFVGEKNREVMSALTAAIWSGSWFVSSKIFKILRESGLPYSQVFFITAFLYAFGVFAYFRLYLAFEKKNNHHEY
jgi:MFS family permease